MSESATIFTGAMGRRIALTISATLLIFISTPRAFAAARSSERSLRNTKIEAKGTREARIHSRARFFVPASSLADLRIKLSQITHPSYQQ